MPEEIQRELNRLSDQLNSLSNEMSNLRQFRDEILYGHGIDNNDSKIDAQKKFKSGDSYFTSGYPSNDNTTAVIATGKDSSVSGGLDQTQLQLIRVTDSSSLLLGFGGKLIPGTSGSVRSGSSVIKTDNLDVEDDELVGQFITIILDGDIAVTDYITSNTNNSVTISVSFSSNESNLTFTIYQPVLLGAATYPWYALSVATGSSAGIHFGGGSQGNGVSTALYSSNGGLYFKKRNGSVTTIVAP